MRTKLPHRKIQLSVRICMAACIIRLFLFGFSSQFFFFVVLSALIILAMIFDFSQFDFGPLVRHWKETQDFYYQDEPVSERKVDMHEHSTAFFWLLVLLSAIFAFHPKGLLILVMSRREMRSLFF